MREGDVAGVDVGGTFTDFVFLDEAGRLRVEKRLSTPEDSSESVLAGLREAREIGAIGPRFLLVHGTTVATNALLERRGAKTALLATAGFRDILSIGRQNRTELYALHPKRERPLLPREACFEIVERVDWRGEIVTPLDTAGAILRLDSLRIQGFDALAVCFLFSYLNPAHEQQIGELARERGFYVSLSCEIAPEPREFERASTTAANAFVGPLLANYVGRLEARVLEADAERMRVMQSNGGALSAREAAGQAIKTALSGPAGGVVAAARIGGASGVTHLLTFDMGGTSTDVALIVNGDCPVTTTGELGGLPLRTPMLDIQTVGAGGGSLARLDAAGGLRVGPESAGASPGPVAYGRGETLTVTDANVLLGRLPAAARLGGTLPLDTKRVRTAFQQLAEKMRLTPEAVAVGILDVANAAMSRALRSVSVERGHDPADFTLVSFGGAGGLHACALAEALQIRSVLVPRYPGAFSALGLALAPVRREYVRSFPATLLSHETFAAFQAHLRVIGPELRAQAQREMTGEGIEPDGWDALFSLDLRYVGQSFALRMAFSPDGSLAALKEAFHARHRAQYGHANPQEPIEAVALRLIATERGTRRFANVSLPARPAQPFATAPVYCGTGWQETPLYRREELAQEQRIEGPALFLQADATTLLLPDWSLQADHTGNIRIGRKIAAS